MWAAQLGPSPPPVPSRVRCSPHRQGPGIPESVHRPSPEASSPPRDSRGNTRAPSWGDTHFPPPPPSAPRAPSSPKEYGRFRIGPKVGAWPRPSSMWAPPRGFGSRPLRTWSRPVVIWSLPASRKLGSSSSSLRAGSLTGAQTDNPQFILHGSLSALLFTHIEISLLSAMVEQ